jgi:hypothetical protein
MELIRADTYYYIRAKRVHFLRVVGTLVFALLAPVLVFWEPAWGDGVAAIAGAWVLLGRTLLSWLEDRFVLRAVTIQEQFDVELFDLEWNESLAGPKAAPEDISSAAMKVHKDKQASKLRDWYANDDQAPWPLNVLLCQRSSAVWGRRGHIQYAFVILGLGVAWLIAGLVMATVAHITVGGYLIKVFLPSQPAFLDTLDLFRGHLSQSQAKEALELKTTELWTRGVGDLDSVTAQDCREVQDQSYQLRRRGIQIPQLIYKLRRKQDEKAMRAAVSRLIKGHFDDVSSP